MPAVMAVYSGSADGQYAPCQAMAPLVIFKECENGNPLGQVPVQAPSCHAGRRIGMHFPPFSHTLYRTMQAAGAPC